MKPSIAQTLDQLERDPFHPNLHTHKLKGSLADRYACSINYADRIIFRFVQNPVSDEEEIFLLAIGSHDEVY